MQKDVLNSLKLDAESDLAKGMLVPEAAHTASSWYW